MGVRSDLEASFDFDIVDEFFDHYTMMVESMEVMIIDLSKPTYKEEASMSFFESFTISNLLLVIFSSVQ